MHTFRIEELFGDDDDMVAVATAMMDQWTSMADPVRQEKMLEGCQLKTTRKLLKRFLEKRLAKARDTSWAGVPVAMGGGTLTYAPGMQPAAVFVSKIAPEQPPAQSGKKPPPVRKYEKYAFRNHWHSKSLNMHISIVERPNGTVFAELTPGDQYKLSIYLETMAGSASWSIKAELKALSKLKRHVSPIHFKRYALAGAFMEFSPKSRIYYVFRRGRPTLAAKDGRILAALCLHPLAYYRSSWAGALVPTDDVIAHLLMMRSDEKFYWRKANQHDPRNHEADF